MQNFNINFNEIDKIKKITAEEKKFRKKNLELFKAVGFPNKRLEDWKFSDFKEIIYKNFEHLDTKQVAFKTSKINLLQDFKHNYIILVNETIQKYS